MVIVISTLHITFDHETPYTSAITELVKQVPQGLRSYYKTKSNNLPFKTGFAHLFCHHTRFF